METNKIWDAVNEELKKAKRAHPNWPDHVAAQAGIVCEEAGELMQAALEFKYEKGKKGRTRTEQKQCMEKEAIQTIVTAIRFLENLK